MKSKYCSSSNSLPRNLAGFLCFKVQTVLCHRCGGTKMCRLITDLLGFTRTLISSPQFRQRGWQPGLPPLFLDDVLVVEPTSLACSFRFLAIDIPALSFTAVSLSLGAGFPDAVSVPLPAGVSVPISGMLSSVSDCASLQAPSTTLVLLLGPSLELTILAAVNSATAAVCLVSMCSSELHCRYFKVTMERMTSKQQGPVDNKDQ